MEILHPRFAASYCQVLESLGIGSAGLIFRGDDAGRILGRWVGFLKAFQVEQIWQIWYGPVKCCRYAMDIGESAKRNSNDLIFFGSIFDHHGVLGPLWLCAMQEAQPETRQGRTWEMQCVRCPSLQPALQVQQMPHRVPWQIKVSQYLGRWNMIKQVESCSLHLIYSVWSIGGWLQDVTGYVSPEGFQHLWHEVRAST